MKQNTTVCSWQFSINLRRNSIGKVNYLKGMCHEMDDFKDKKN
jgi:hypothetical protein